jgi:hypothetical protein
MTDEASDEIIGILLGRPLLDFPEGLAPYGSMVTTQDGLTAEIIAWLGPHAICEERDPFASERVAMVNVVDGGKISGIPRDASHADIRFAAERSIQFVRSQHRPLFSALCFGLITRKLVDKSRAASGTWKAQLAAENSRRIAANLFNERRFIDSPPPELPPFGSLVRMKHGNTAEVMAWYEPNEDEETEFARERVALLHVIDGPIGNNLFQAESFIGYAGESNLTLIRKQTQPKFAMKLMKAVLAGEFSV